MEDYWNIHRELIYRERKNLNDFGVKDSNSLNGRLFQLLSENFLSTDGADKLLLQCFNNAYYLCTIILLEDLPHLRVDKYEKNLLEMNVQWNDDACAASFAMAYEMLQVCEPKYTNDSLLLKAIHNRFHCRPWIGIAAAQTFYKLIDKVKKDDIILPKNEFAPRDIVEAIEEFGEEKPHLLEHGVEYICERLVLVSEPRKRIYGADLAIAYLKGFLQETYKDYNYDSKNKRFKSLASGDGYDIHYIESFDSDVDSIKEAIKYITEHYPSKENVVEPERALDNKILQTSTKEQDSKLIEHIRLETAKLQARIKELEEALDVEKAKNSKLEEQIANRTQTESDEFVKMKRRNETLESLNQANENRLKTYESIFGTEEQVSKEKQFSITERIIFCSALLGCGLREEDISQMQMAKLISKFSGDKPEPIRTTINRMNKKQKALVEVAEKAKQEEDAGAREIIWRVEGEKYNGITNAALNVYKYLHAAIKGQTIGAKVYCCKQAMENINQAYYLMERKLINRTDLQPKGEFELPPEEI